jgi:hypothetical protein
LMAAGLVDEIALSVCPVFLAAGTPMLRLAGALSLELQGRWELPSGVRRYRYVVRQACRQARAPAGRSAGKGIENASRERLTDARRALKARQG